MCKPNRVEFSKTFRSASRFESSPLNSVLQTVNFCSYTRTMRKIKVSTGIWSKKQTQKKTHKKICKENFYFFLFLKKNQKKWKIEKSKNCEKIFWFFYSLAFKFRLKLFHDVDQWLIWFKIQFELDLNTKTFRKTQFHFFPFFSTNSQLRNVHKNCNFHHKVHLLYFLVECWV